MGKRATMEPTAEADRAAERPATPGIEPSAGCPVCQAVGAVEEVDRPRIAEEARPAPEPPCAGCGASAKRPRGWLRLCGPGCTLEQPADDHLERVAAHRARITREEAALRAAGLDPRRAESGRVDELLARTAS